MPAVSLLDPVAAEALARSLETGRLPAMRFFNLEAAVQALRQGWSLPEITAAVVYQLERALILRALQASGGNLAAAARLLRLSPQTLRRKLRAMPEMPYGTPEAAPASQRAS
ncbi:MAG: hypothetical protein KatS3mg131_1136 [Candidatus Tectimicrobiota bacterium]|nr:MAG: hypothetical protein KatS3mg131_1136 [Candidatus Tectomicrobia bacterium]